MENNDVRIAYAGNREIGLEGVRLLQKNGIDPVALLLPSKERSTVRNALRDSVEPTLEIDGPEWEQNPRVLDELEQREPDYLLMVHYPHILPEEVLEIPKLGTLNLHPAYLPYNRGWHTPTWAILEQTPFGGTLHWVDEGIDTGPIALREEIELRWEDTAHEAYQRALQVELRVLDEAIPLLKKMELPRKPQGPEGTSHNMADLEESGVREIDLDGSESPRTILRKLRALTTDRWSEAAYFEEDGIRYLARIEIERADDLLDQDAATDEVNP